MRDKRAFLAALGSRLERKPSIQYIFPVGDTDLAAIAEGYEELGRRCRLVMVEPGALRACLEKPKMHEIAARIGVPVPESRLIADEPGALDAAIVDIGFPVLGKRPNSFSLIDRRKAVICRGWSTVAPLRPALRTGPILLQQWVHGPRHNCQIAAFHGDLVAYFENRNLRTDRFDGTGFGVEWISVNPTPELRRHCAALAKAVGYSGVGLLQFLMEGGRPYFLEFNPRLGMPWELCYRCGLDFATLAVRCADKLRDPALALPRAPEEYAVGKRCYWLHGDLMALADSERGLFAIARRLIAMIVSFRGADFQLTWSWRDPLPTLYLYACFAKSCLSKLAPWRALRAKA